MAPAECWYLPGVPRTSPAADGLPLVVIGKATMFAVIQAACRGSSAESAGSPLERVRALVVSPNRAAGSAASGGPAILVRDSSKTGMDE